MSDIEYSESESETESVVEPVAKLRKTGKSIGKESAELYDDDAENSDSESEASASIAESIDSDIDDLTPDEMDENVLFADMAKNKEDDEFQFGFDSGEDGTDLDDDDDDDEDAKYLQKLDESVKQQTIANHHPELIIHNYDEVEALTVVVRDERGVIIDPLHRTLPFLSKYEKTRILGERAKQINDGAEPFVETVLSVIDGYLIALKELEERKLPFILRRPLCNGASEYWKLNDLEFL
jgi:DNA-directed RNA polymerase subunit K/omega